MPVHTCETPTGASSIGRLLLNTFGKTPSSTMSMLTVVVLLTIQASRFLFLIVALWNYYSFGEENSRKSESQGLEYNASQPHYQQQKIAQWRSIGNVQSSI